MTEDVRWKQRFENFERAYTLFKEIFIDGNPHDLSELEKAGGIQRFEFTFELSWKLMKDYLEWGGIEPDEAIPRQIIKEAFAAKLIDDGKVWIDMLKNRNELSHTYSGEILASSIEKIRREYAEPIRTFYTLMARNYSDEDA